MFAVRRLEKFEIYAGCIEKLASSLGWVAIYSEFCSVLIKFDLIFLLISADSDFYIFSSDF